MSKKRFRGEIDALKDDVIGVDMQEGSKKEASIAKSTAANNNSTRRLYGQKLPASDSRRRRRGAWRTFECNSQILRRD